MSNCKIIVSGLILYLLLCAHLIQAQHIIQTTIHTIPENSLTLTSVNDTFDLKGDYYVSSKAFADMLNVPFTIDTVLHSATLAIRKTHITLFADNPFIKIDNTLYQMPIDVKEYGGELYIPLREFITILDRNFPGEYIFNESNKTLDIFFNEEINIPEVFIEEKTNGSLIHIKTLKYFGKDFHSWFDTTRYQVTVEFYGGKLDTTAIDNLPTKGLVLSVKSFQKAEIATIIFKVSRYVGHFEAMEDQRSGEISIILIRKGTASIIEPIEGFVPPAKGNVEEIVAREKEKWAIDTIIIDPGHGGRDPGTIGPDGTREKDIVLDIAVKLGNLISTSKLVEKVIYTRDSDIFIPLQERAKIANNNTGKLFISIHINSNTNGNLRGFETYFIHPGKTQDALEVLEVVQRENNVMNLYEGKEPNRELTEEDKMVLAITQSAFVKESEKLATFVAEGLERTTEWHNRGVKQAGFLVLWGVSMPNVLIEAGYITNQQEREDLRSSAVRHRIAEGIYIGIKKFIEEMRK